jgi:hypothetical protein
MHHVIAWPIVVVSVVALAGCADLVGPNARGVAEPTRIAELAHRRPEPPVSLPDSVRIPLPPIPPIYEELPPILEAPQ